MVYTVQSDTGDTGVYSVEYITKSAAQGPRHGPGQQPSEQPRARTGGDAETFRNT